MIKIQGLTKHYGTLAAVQDLSLTVPPGELFGLLGPNGAGNTRVMKILAGLLILYLLLAALWGLGVGVGMGPGYYPLSVLIVLFLPLLPVALGTLLMMALVRYLPAWRLREMLAVAGSLLRLLFYVTSQVFSADLQARLMPMTQSPNLTWEDPRRAYSQEAGCAGYVAGGAYALIIVAILAVPTGLAGRSATWDLSLAALRLVAVIGLTAGVVWKALRLAVERTQAIEL